MSEKQLEHYIKETEYILTIPTRWPDDNWKLEGKLEQAKQKLERLRQTS